MALVSILTAAVRSPSGGWLPAACGLALLSLNLWGALPRATDSQAHCELLRYRDAIRRGSPFDLGEATVRVYAGTRHSDRRQIRPCENWLQWVLSALHAPLARTQDADLLVAGGCGDCSERGQILRSICESAGAKCRFVGLGGHILLEVSTDDGPWRAADADYGVVYPCDVHGLEDAAVRTESPDDETASPFALLARRGYDGAIIERYRQIVATRADNVWLDEGAPMSPRLDAVERGCRWLVWAIPLALVLCPAAMRRKLDAGVRAF